MLLKATLRFRRVPISRHAAGSAKYNKITNTCCKIAQPCSVSKLACCPALREFDFVDSRRLVLLVCDVAQRITP